MKHIHIDGLENRVSRLIMGSDYFRPSNMEVVNHMLDAYVGIGGNTIDTAYVYCGGDSERAIGLWLQSRGNRAEVNVWTKGAHPNKDGSRMNRQAIVEELDTSLDRLQTDYVDLYALHRDDRNVPVGEILEILNEQCEKGKIKAFGASNWTWQRLEEANEYASTHGLRGFSFNSPNFSLAKAQEPYWPDCVSADEETLNWHRRTELPLLSWSSQARGFFTGRFSRDDHSNADLVRVFYNHANWARYDRAVELAEQKQVSPIQIALAYVLNQSFPTCAIIGPQNEEEMVSCQQGAEISLTKEEVAFLVDGSERG